MRCILAEMSRNGIIRVSMAGSFLAVFLSLAIYLSNGRTIGSGDTVGPALVPVALLTEGTVNLSKYAPELAPPGMLPYYLRAGRGGVWPVYSIAPGILAAPLYAIPVWWHSRTKHTAKQWLDWALVWQKYSASLITALSVGVFFRLVMVMGASGVSAAVLTTAYAIGSQEWSISSQALWQHGPASLALLIVAAVSVSFRTKPSFIKAVSGGVVLGLLASIRPFTLVLAVPIAVWGMQKAGKPGFRLAWIIPSLLFGSSWIVYSHWVFGDSMGMYQGAFGMPSLEAIAGMLASPARGLLPYFPVGILAIAGFLRGRRGKWGGLYSTMAFGAVAHLVLLTFHPDWGGGHGFGPRYCTELQPVLLLLAVPWFSSLAKSTLKMRVAGVLIAWGVGVQAVGAYLYPSGCWDDDPVQVESMPARLWDWKDNPVFREVRTAFSPAKPAGAPLSGWSAGYSVPRMVVMEPGATASIPVGVTNTGKEGWPISPGRECSCIVHLSWHIRGAGGRFVRYEGTRVPLGTAVQPGESVRLSMPVTAPEAGGDYLLEVTLVQERVAWFEDRGVEPGRILLRVRSGNPSPVHPEK